MSYTTFWLQNTEWGVFILTEVCTLCGLRRLEASTEVGTGCVHQFQPWIMEKLTTAGSS